MTLRFPRTQETLLIIVTARKWVHVNAIISAYYRPRIKQKIYRAKLKKERKNQQQPNLTSLSRSDAQKVWSADLHLFVI